MSYNSFIFHVEDRPYDCGCYYDCNCPSRDTDVELETSVEDAADYLVRLINKDWEGYIDAIFVNGVRITPRKAMQKGKTVVYVNPISSLDPVHLAGMIDLTTVPETLAIEAATLLQSMYEVARPQAMIRIDTLNEKLRKDEAHRRDVQQKHDLAELERLKKLYPDM